MIHSHLRIPAPLAMPLATMLALLVTCATALQHRAKVEQQNITQQERKNNLLAEETRLHSEKTQAENMEGMVKRLEAEQIFAPQDRLSAAEALQTYREQLGIAEISWTISPVEEQPLPPSRLFARQSSVSLQVRALTDADIHALMAGLAADLPGQLRLRRLAMTRNRPLTESLEEQIMQGQLVWLVEAQIDYDWLTARRDGPDKGQE